MKMTKIIITITEQQWGAMIEVADKAAATAGKAWDDYEKAGAVAATAGSAAVAHRATHAADKAGFAARKAYSAYEKAAAVSRQRAAEVKAVCTLRDTPAFRPGARARS